MMSPIDAFLDLLFLTPLVYGLSFAGMFVYSAIADRLARRQSRASSEAAREAREKPFVPPHDRVSPDGDEAREGPFEF
jgi:hypothetical protein